MNPFTPHPITPCRATPASTRRSVVFGLLTAGLCAGLSMPAHAENIFMKRSWSHAVGGHDVVAYHTEGAAVRGDDAHTMMLYGVSWRFSSAENMATFAANPDAYRPQYGGYCAWAMAKGKKATGDPQVWHIHDDKLYLNVSQGIKRKWLRDIEGFIARADAAWAAL
ncbi:MAG: YHS domain-containing (seleno)protein [Pseudomonadota bacterium]